MRLPVGFKLFLIVTAFLSFASGFTSIGDALKYRQPVQMTLARFEQIRPTAGWYSIADGFLDVPNSIPKEGTTGGYYVPIKAPGTATLYANKATEGTSDANQIDTDSSPSSHSDLPTDPYYVIAYVTDPKLIQRIDAYNNSVNRPMTANGMLHLSDLKAIPAQSSIPVQISGMVLTDGSQEDDDMANLHVKFNTDARIMLIGLGTHPDTLTGFELISCGVLMVIGVLWFFGVKPSVSGIKEAIGQGSTGKVHINLMFVTITNRTVNRIS